MIHKKISEVSIDDIQGLINSKMPEGKTIEYKKELKINIDSDKKEFLADVYSFSNTSGGDLILGINTQSGVPVSFSPLKIDDLDAEKLRIENIIRTGIDPRISFILQPIETAKNEYILVLRINESWNKPHRVIFGGSNKFYARNSAGKYELDVEELRNIFNLSSGLLERINNFRIERAIEIQSSPSEISLDSRGGKAIIHIIPLESFSNKISVSTEHLVKTFIHRSGGDTVANSIQPMRSGGWSHRVTSRGLMSYDQSEKGIRSYVEIYKNGIAEIVLCEVVGGTSEYKVFFMNNMELLILENVPKYLEIQKFLNIQTPSYIFITFTGLKNAWLKKSMDTYREDYRIPKDTLYLPEAILQNYDDDLAKVLKPSFDIVWNNAGIMQSTNYDKDGNLKGKADY